MLIHYTTLFSIEYTNFFFNNCTNSSFTLEIQLRDVPKVTPGPELPPRLKDIKTRNRLAYLIQPASLQTIYLEEGSTDSGYVQSRAGVRGIFADRRRHCHFGDVTAVRQGLDVDYIARGAKSLLRKVDRYWLYSPPLLLPPPLSSLQACLLPPPHPSASDKTCGQRAAI